MGEAHGVNRFLAVDDDEIGPLLWATAYHFVLLLAYFVIRPIRDEMGIAGGVRNLPWLFLGTLLGMLVVHPLFTALVAQLPRARFIPLSYAFFALNLVAFWALFRTVSADAHVWAGRLFFVWTSVFNLFVVSIFWSLMVDRFRPEQAARLFGFIAVGGTLGAAVGSSVTATLAGWMVPTDLLLVSACFLAVATLAALRVMGGAGPRAGLRIGGGVWDGIRTVTGSPYLLGIVGYMLLFTVTATFLYFQQAEIVEAAITDRAARTVFLARIDLAVNGLTALIQVFLTGRIVRRIGVALSLATLPLVCVVGFAALGASPTLLAIAGFQVLRRTSNYAIARPCREMLYTVLSRDSKYKAKNFVDTAVYRLGDQIGAWSYAALAALGWGAAGVSGVAAPLAAVWLGLGLWLGRQQVRMR